MKDGNRGELPEATIDAARDTHAAALVTECDAQPSKALAEPKRNRRGGDRNVRHGLTSGSLPRGCSWIAKNIREFRQAVEAAVIEARGEISLFDAACVNTAARWEQHALLAQRWLRREAETLAPNDKLAFSREIAKASAERDRALRALGLDKRPGDDPFADLFDRPTIDASGDHAASSDPTAGTATEADEGEPIGRGDAPNGE